MTTNESHAPHILPLRVYLTIGAVLLFLTGVTIWVAQYSLGPMNLLVAMIIAAVKGTLVALFFMHLKYTSKLHAVIFVGALGMVAVFIIFTMFDTLARDQIYEIRANPIENRAVIYRDSAIETRAADSAAPSESDSSVVDNH